MSCFKGSVAKTRQPLLECSEKSSEALWLWSWQLYQPMRLKNHSNLTNNSPLNSHLEEFNSSLTVFRCTSFISILMIWFRSLWTPHGVKISWFDIIITITLRTRNEETIWLRLSRLWLIITCTYYFSTSPWTCPE